MDVRAKMNNSVSNLLVIHHSFETEKQLRDLENKEKKLLDERNDEDEERDNGKEIVESNNENNNEYNNENNNKNTEKLKCKLIKF